MTPTAAKLKAIELLRAADSHDEADALLAELNEQDQLESPPPAVVIDGESATTADESGDRFAASPDSSAEIAVIDAQAAAAVSVIEATAAAEIAVAAAAVELELEVAAATDRPEPEPELDILGGDEPEPEPATTHWFYRKH